MVRMAEQAAVVYRRSAKMRRGSYQSIGAWISTYHPGDVGLLHFLRRRRRTCRARPVVIYCGAWSSVGDKGDHLLLRIPVGYESREVRADMVGKPQVAHYALHKCPPCPPNISRSPLNYHAVCDSRLASIIVHCIQSSFHRRLLRRPDFLAS